MNSSTVSARSAPKESAKTHRRQERTIQIPLAWLELLFGLVLLIGVAVYLYEATQLPVPINPKAVGAGDFPMMIASGTLVAIFMMCCQGLWKVFREKKPVLVSLNRPVSVIIAMLVLGGIGAFLDALGVIIAMVSLSALLMVAAGERRPLQLIAVPLGLALGLYAVFVLVLSVYFP